MWDAATRHLKATLVGHTDQIRAVVFSPDGRTLASAGGRDYTVRLWDVATGQAVAILTGHVGGVLSVVFSPDGETLASTGRDGTVLLWNSPLLVSEAEVLQTAISQVQQQNSGQPKVRLAYFYPSDDDAVQLDLNRDGVLNILDLVMTASNFGATEKPTRRCQCGRCR